MVGTEIDYANNGSSNNSGLIGTDNVVYANGGMGINLAPSSAGVADSIYLYNNTSYGNGSDGVKWAPTSGTNTLIAKNNISAGNGGNAFNYTSHAGATLTASNNSNGGGTYGGAWAANKGIGNVEQNPLFVSPSTGDFHLQPTSPAIDAGTNVGLTSDFAGNPIVGNPDIGAYEYQPLTVTINQKSDQADPANSSTINFTVVFSESVSDFVTGDVTLSGTAGATTATVTGSGTTYNVAVTGMTGNGTVIASLNAGVATGATGNTNEISTSTDNSVTYDIIAPSTPGYPSTASNHTNNTKPTWTWDASTDSGSGLDSTAPYTVEWSMDPNFNSGVYTDTASTNSYTHSTPLDDGSWNFRVKAKDKAGNFSDWTQNAYEWIDTTAPVVNNVTSTTTDGAWKAGDAVNVRVSFNESVTVVGSPQIKLQTNNGNQYATYSGGSGSQNIDFTYTVASGDNTTDLDYTSTSALELNGGTIQDGAGNDATLTLASPGANYSLSHNKDLVLDTTPPIITITDPDTTPAQSKTISASVEGGSTVFTINSPGNDSCTGSLDGLDSFPGTYLFSNEDDNGKKVCFKAQDAAGNTAYALSDAIGGIDTTAPDTIIDSNPSDPSNSNSATFTFHATETSTFQCKLDSGDYSVCTSLRITPAFLMEAILSMSKPPTWQEMKTPLRPATLSW